MKFSYHPKKRSKFYKENSMVSYESAGISELRRQRNNTKTHSQDCLIAVNWIGVVSYMKQYVITVGGLMILRQRVFFTSNSIGFIARLHPQSPSHFAWRPPARVPQTLRSSYLSHMIGAAKISRKIRAHLSPRIQKHRFPHTRHYSLSRLAALA